MRRDRRSRRACTCGPAPSATMVKSLSFSAAGGVVIQPARSAAGSSLRGGSRRLTCLYWSETLLLLLAWCFTLAAGTR
jgi:hypothetical protein